MPTTSARDLGAVQRKESGTPTAATSYVDLGASQRVAATASLLWVSTYQSAGGTPWATVASGMTPRSGT